MCLERPLLGLMLLNPPGLDTAALMGYTGALFQQFFGIAWGNGLSIAALLLSATVPALLSLRAYRRKDF